MATQKKKATKSGTPKASAQTSKTDVSMKRAQGGRAAKKAAVEKGEKPTMSEQLREARQRYTRSKSALGTPSAHNGDDVATLLAGTSPEVVCSVAETLAGVKAGEFARQYGHLNPGQVRMCAGNRIRAMVKKNTVTVDDVAKTLAAL